MISKRYDHRRTPRVFYYVHPAVKAASIRSSKTGRQICSQLSNYSEEDNLSSMIKSFENENRSMLLPNIPKNSKSKKQWLDHKENCLRDYSAIQEKICKLNKNRVLAKQTHFKCQVNRMKHYMSPSCKYL